jgi:Tfp pilus assembly protein PilO
MDAIVAQRLELPASSAPRDLFDLLAGARDAVSGAGFSRAQLRDQVAALRSRLEEQNHRLLSAPDQNQAGAQFLTWLSAGATQQQLGFTRSEFLPPVPVGEKYIRVPVRLELNGRITPITQFLAAITSGDHLVSIDELELASGSDKEKRIHCTFVVSALMARVK